MHELIHPTFFVWLKKYLEWMPWFANNGRQFHGSSEETKFAPIKLFSCKVYLMMKWKDDLLWLICKWPKWPQNVKVPASERLYKRQNVPFRQKKTIKGCVNASRIVTFNLSHKYPLNFYCHHIYCSIYVSKPLHVKQIYYDLHLPSYFN